MNIALGLFVLSLVGAEGPQNREGPEITYDVRVIKMNGLDWRGTFFSRLQPVTSQAGTSVWTTSRETAGQLSEQDPNRMRMRLVTATSPMPAVAFARNTRKVASGVTRLADGPFDHATQVAYTPRYEAIREGLAITVSGRKLDQGVLACVVLDDTRVAAVHRVALTENVAAKECCDGNCRPACDKIASRIEVPEIAHAEARGEWLIPNDGALVVSLGVQTTADPEGKAVTVERLVLIEATAATDDAVKPAALTCPLRHPIGDWAPLPRREESGVAAPGCPVAGPAAAGGVVIAKPIPKPMPTPAIPSRSLPQARAADGSPMPLPPLPEDHATPSSLPGTSEPCASPQAPHHRPSEPTTLDLASTKVGYSAASSPEKEKEKERENKRTSEPDSGGSSRPCLLRFPLNAGNLNLEVEIRMASPFATFGRK